MPRKARFSITIEYTTDGMDSGTDHRKIVKRLREEFPHLVRPFVNLGKHKLVWSWAGDKD